jgi:hypothetical protein
LLGSLSLREDEHFLDHWRVFDAGDDSDIAAAGLDVTVVGESNAKRNDRFCILAVR